MSIPVAVVGAPGRMGQLAVEAITAADDLELVAQLGRNDPLTLVNESGAHVLLDFTSTESSPTHVKFALTHGIDAVVGTSGWDHARRQALTQLLTQYPERGVLIAPNFALGAVLASQFAALAAPYFDSAEIIELHHPHKRDAPSGTATRTAELMATARAHIPKAPDATATALPGARGASIDGIPVHSVRLAGLAAHQEVLLGAEGEQLSIRHDSFGHASFKQGILVGIRRVSQRPGLTYGLENYLDIALTS